MSFFKQFPNIPYDFDRNGIFQNVVNIYRHVQPLKAFADELNTYTFYQVKNGERPDLVSYRLYGTTEYYWTFFILNDFLHDGLAAWPMSQEKLHDYMAEEYEGVVITTKPSPGDSGDDGVAFGLSPNSIAGRFTLGETITGTTSGATGTLVKKNTDLNQLVLQDVSGAFIGSSGGYGRPSTATENINGSTNQDNVNTYDVYNYIDAPHSYYLIGDGDRRQETNANFIPGGTVSNILEFQTNRSYLFEANEARSSIKIIDPRYIGAFVDEYQRLLNND